MEDSKLSNFIFHYHPSTKCIYRIGLSVILGNGCNFMKWLLSGKNVHTSKQSPTADEQGDFGIVKSRRSV